MIDSNSVEKIIFFDSSRFILKLYLDNKRLDNLLILFKYFKCFKLFIEFSSSKAFIKTYFVLFSSEDLNFLIKVSILSKIETE